MPVASVGGEFYTFLRLSPGRVGVMLGDVSSHGMAAALVMALVLAAAGIHTTADGGPAETLRGLRESLVAKLSETEMYASVFYGVLDRGRGTLSYANAGHPHAYRVPARGAAERLEATTPPLGLGLGAPIVQREVPWVAQGDLLALWTDGLVDAADAGGQRFGEARLVERLEALRDRPPEEIVTTVMEEVDRHSPAPDDDRTFLILRF
jgi:phosphoserine phosphatase RsbU/P